MRILTLLTIVFMLSACGSSDSGTGSTKSLTSTWTSTSDGSVLDLTNAPLNSTFYIHPSFAGVVCTARMTLLGDQLNGTAEIFMATADDGITHHSATCHVQFDGTYSYTKNGSSLIVCRDQTGTCTTYN